MESQLELLADRKRGGVRHVSGVEIGDDSQDALPLLLFQLLFCFFVLRRPGRDTIIRGGCRCRLLTRILRGWGILRVQGHRRQKDERDNPLFQWSTLPCTRRDLRTPPRRRDFATNGLAVLHLFTMRSLSLLTASSGAGVPPCLCGSSITAWKIFEIAHGLTSYPFLHQNTPVRSAIAGGTVAALLLATLYAPLFHVHMHAGEAPLIHAHLPEVVPTEDESVVHMETFHSHADARSLDLFTTTVVQPIHFDAAIVTSAAELNTIVLSHGYVRASAPVAHGPPDSKFQIPRAPPA